MAKDDFNGDGRSDVLWRDAGGTVTPWFSDQQGGFGVSGTGTRTSSHWSVSGTGDFNGDGLTDILWREDAGRLTDWLGNSDGSFSPNNNKFWAPVTNEWSSVGIGDFNGDGRDDVLWRHWNGTVTNWLGQADGSLTPNADALWESVPYQRKVAATGDFNNDGRADVLWRNEHGEFTVWHGTESGSLEQSNVWTYVPTEWQIIGAGDFNGDGHDDLLWQNTDGILTNWLGTAGDEFDPNAANIWLYAPPEWHVEATGDYDGDGVEDVLWRNDAGTVTNWLGQSDGSFLPNPEDAWITVPMSWQVESNQHLWQLIPSR